MRGACNFREINCDLCWVDSDINAGRSVHGYTASSEPPRLISQCSLGLAVFKLFVVMTNYPPNVITQMMYTQR